jgi:hypothetical protein
VSTPDEIRRAWGPRFQDLLADLLDEDDVLAVLSRWETLLAEQYAAPVSSSKDTPARARDAETELFCRDCGHPDSPWGNDTSWMCARHRPAAEVPAGGEPA